MVRAESLVENTISLEQSFLKNSFSDSFFKITALMSAFVFALGISNNIQAQGMKDGQYVVSFDGNKLLKPKDDSQIINNFFINAKLYEEMGEKPIKKEQLNDRVLFILQEIRKEAGYLLEILKDDSTKIFIQQNFFKNEKDLELAIKRMQKLQANGKVTLFVNNDNAAAVDLNESTTWFDFFIPTGGENLDTLNLKSTIKHEVFHSMFHIFSKKDYTKTVFADFAKKELGDNDNYYQKIITKLRQDLEKYKKINVSLEDEGSVEIFNKLLKDRISEIELVLSNSKNFEDWKKTENAETFIANTDFYYKDPVETMAFLVEIYWHLRRKNTNGLILENLGKDLKEIFEETDDFDGLKNFMIFFNLDNISNNTDNKELEKCLLEIDKMFNSLKIYK